MTDPTGQQENAGTQLSNRSDHERKNDIYHTQE